ncbi:MAG: FG-GAP-like repeat-containing protein, partial [Myxococcota bacterium]
DGWPDLVVANDTSNRLRVYRNREGRFERQTDFDDPSWDGSWMGTNSGDLDGDLLDDVFVSNFGGQVFSIRNNAVMVDDASELNIGALSVINVPTGHARIGHVVLSHRPETAFAVAASDEAIVSHHPSMPPDVVDPDNVVRAHRDFARQRFARGLDALEFSWNAALFDVDNDGDLDVYFAGALKRGNDRFFGDIAGGPGRMLVNQSRPAALAFTDRTLEYRLLDIRYVDYEADVPERPAPGTRWHKRDRIRLTDLDAYTGSGLEASDGSAVRDLFRMHEAAHGVFAADLNRDGWSDLVVTHGAGYDSVSPEARNLKVSVGGRVLAVPAANQRMSPPTQFEPGHTSLYVHGGPRHGDDPHWIRIRLLDDGPNRYGVGARVVLDGRIARTMEPTGQAFGGVHDGLLVGLGEAPLERIEVVWPDGPIVAERYVLPEPTSRRELCLMRGTGPVACP